MVSPQPAAISLAVLPLRPRSVLFSAVARARDAANKSPTGAAGLTNFPSEKEPKEWQETISSTENHQSMEVRRVDSSLISLLFLVASGISSRCKRVNHGFTTIFGVVEPSSRQPVNPGSQRNLSASNLRDGCNLRESRVSIFIDPCLPPERIHWNSCFTTGFFLKIPIFDDLSSFSQLILGLAN